MTKTQIKEVLFALCVISVIWSYILFMGLLKIGQEECQNKYFYKHQAYKYNLFLLFLSK